MVETGQRHRWTDDEKLSIVLESLQAPRAVSSTARRHGISRSLLSIWRRSFEAGVGDPERPKPAFVPAMVVDESAGPAPPAAPSSQMVIEIGEHGRVILDAASMQKHSLGCWPFWGAEDPSCGRGRDLDRHRSYRYAQRHAGFGIAGSGRPRARSFCWRRVHVLRPCWDVDQGTLARRVRVGSELSEADRGSNGVPTHSRKAV